MGTMPGSARAGAALVLGLLAAPALAQQPAVTADDYARAEKMLSHNTSPLVDHAVQAVRWPDDGHVVWVESDGGAMEFSRLDLASGTVEPAIVHALLS